MASVKKKGARRTCEICGIKEAHSPDTMFFANFPLNEDRCREWVRVTGNEYLSHLPLQKLNTAKYVCSLHFKPKDFAKSGKRLKKRAVPSLHLTAPPLNNYQLAYFPHQPDNAQVSLPSTSREDQHSSGVAASGPSSSTSAVQNVQDTIEKHMPSTSIGEQCSSTVAASGSLSSTSAVKNIQGSVKTSTSKGDQSSTTVTVLGPASHTCIVQNVQDSACSTSRGDPISSETTATSVATGSKGVKRKLVENEELTPRKRKLVERLTKTKCTLNSLKKSAMVIEKIKSPVLKEMVLNACKNENRKPRGRRWTLQHKLSCLAILKRSPKTYRHLGAAVPLPSIKTLLNLLKKIPLKPGISSATLNHLKNLSKNKNDKEKTCCLVFDEMAIKSRLLYEESSDVVEGFEDLGEHGRKNNVSDHALVFLLQGVYKKFKQPIAYYFTKGTISSAQLAVIIKRIIREVRACGFNIINTVCDQGPTNMGAMKILKDGSGPLEDGANHYFIIDGKKVFIIYDIPHLFKSIRNNFMNTGNLVFNGCKAKWKHLKDMEYENRNFLYLSKITPTHVNPKYKGKMRVKLAAQLLSNTTGAILTLMARAQQESTKSKELQNTAQVIRELDKLFDITNGPSGPKDKKKGIRTNVSKKTKHMDTWGDYLKKLEKTHFVNNYGQISTNVKCIEGYIISLKSLRDIWSTVQSLGFKYLNLRNLNQDALENLFGVIRQHSPTNRNPTAAHFTSALKTAIVTGLTAPHSRGANCEEDNKHLLTDFINFIMEDEDDQEINKENIEEQMGVERITSVRINTSEEEVTLSIPESAEEEMTDNDFTLLSEQPVVYVAGYLAKQIEKIVKCEDCKNILTVGNPENNPMYSYIMLREWWKEKFSLTYPSTSLCELVKSLKLITEKEILPRLHEYNVSLLGCTLFSVHAPNIKVSCDLHANVSNLLYEKSCKLFIRRQCQIINQSFSTKEEELTNLNKKAEQLGKAK